MWRHQPQCLWWFERCRPCLWFRHMKFYQTTERVDLLLDSFWRSLEQTDWIQLLDANQFVEPNRHSHIYKSNHIFVKCKSIEHPINVHEKKSQLNSSGLWKWNSLVIGVCCQWECDHRCVFIASQLWVGADATKQSHIVDCCKKRKTKTKQISSDILTSNREAAGETYFFPYVSDFHQKIRRIWQRL